MSKVVDTRGMACPQPVILARKALHEEDEIVVIVDNDTSRYNVTRMAERSGCTVTSETRADGTYLHIRKGAPATQAAQPRVGGATEGPLVVAISQDRMGFGDPELGAVLIRSFLHTLNEIHPLPASMIFFNTGVRLVVEGSPVLEDLQVLHQQGVEILACGTCLGYFDLKEKVAVGEVSNMYTIAETLLGAGKVVNL